MIIDEYTFRSNWPGVDQIGLGWKQIDLRNKSIYNIYNMIVWLCD